MSTNEPLHPKDEQFLEHALDSFETNYVEKFSNGCVEHADDAPFAECRRSVIVNAREEVLDLWSYLTLLESRMKEARIILEEIKDSDPGWTRQVDIILQLLQ